MLGMKKYDQTYVEQCRSKIRSDVAAFKKLAAKRPAGIEALEGAFFTNMLLVLDRLFVHRLRVVEGKDANPLSEVRVLCNSIVHNKGVMTADKSIKLTPATSVLTYEPGDTIELSQADFDKMSKAFFAEIEKKFV